MLLGLLLITTGTAWLIMLPPKVDNSGYTLIENLKIPVYSKVKIKDLKIVIIAGLIGDLVAVISTIIIVNFIF